MSRRVGLRYMQSVVARKKLPKWEGSTDSRYREGCIVDQPEMAFVHVNAGGSEELLQMAFVHSNAASGEGEGFMAFVHSNGGCILAPYPP